MESWKLRGQEVYLLNSQFYKVTFPDFWEEARKNKNRFYDKIKEIATTHVEKTGKGGECLEDDNLHRFWHDHCEFCWEKVTAEEHKECYCTTDFRYWVCGTCFHEFSKQFRWSVIDFT